MPDVYLRSIEPLIAIILDRYAVATPSPPSDALSLPSLGVSSLDLGRLWQRRRPFFLCMPSRRRSLGAETCRTPPLGVNDQASSISDTATITATSPIKIRLPGVPIVTSVPPMLSFVSPAH